MNKMKLIVGALLFVFFTADVYADVAEEGKINRIIVEGQSMVSVWLDGTDNNSECAGSGRWTINKSEDQMFKEKLSTLLSVAQSKQTIRLFHLTSYGCGSWNSNKIYYINVAY